MRPPCPDASARFIQRRSHVRPKVGIVLGSGFGPVANAIGDAVHLPYSSIPGFPDASVPGHAGRMILGTWHGQPVAVLAGRCHYYEGLDWHEVTFGVRVLAAMGVSEVLLTNAAGGIRRGSRPGDFMAICDHINLMGSNPLRGPVAPGRERFVDMTRAYDPELLQRLKKAGKAARIPVFHGVYAAVQGPSFETPAEIRAFARMGADAVGMSTVPEAIVARQCGVRVAGLSCITNVAAGLAGKGQQVTHAEVLEVAHTVAARATRLVEAWVRLAA